MNQNVHRRFSLLFFVLSSFSVLAAEPPAPLLPVPTGAQQAWQSNDAALFLNFGLNTFLGEEQGNGQGDPRIFNPTKLDAKEWVALAKECGFKRIVLSAKNHDGFCLWPSKFSDYSVANTPWRGGKGDVLKEFSDACHDAGIEVGFSLSCEDRHHPAFGTDDYNRVYLGQLTELLSAYGTVSELRVDGAGGIGGGAMGSVDLPAKRQDYDWQKYFATVHALQPRTIIVGAAGPDARWNGNNIGHAGDPIWCPFDLRSLPGPEPATVDQLKVLNAGDPAGTTWLPPECFVRLRPHWSWRAEDDTNVLSPDKLFNTWCKSVGRGCVLLLNVPLDRDGRVPEAEARNLRELHRLVGQAFATDLVAGNAAKAGSVRGDDLAYTADRAVDGDEKTYWTPAETGTNDWWLEIDAGKAIRFDTSLLQEPIVLGQRVASYRIDAWQDGQWKTVVHGTSIGRMKVERFNPVTADKVRLVIERSRAVPLISRFSLYRRSD